MPSKASSAKYRPQSLRRREFGRVTAGKTKTGGFFNDLPAIIAAFPDVVRDIVDETASDFIDAATSKAPRGATGQLSTSYRVRPRDSSRGYMVRVDFTATSEVRGKDSHLYPFYVEVGTKDTRAQPFVLPAILETRPKFHDRLRALERRLPR